MKYRFSVTIEIEDTEIYAIDYEGLPVGSSLGKVERPDVASYIHEAVSYWGGQRAPADPFFTANIQSVKITDDLEKIIYS